MSSDDSGRGGLNLTIIRSINVNFPSVEEQEAIAAVLSDMDAEITALEQRLEKAKAIKQGMMQQLLTGRIRLVDPSTPVEASASGSEERVPKGYKQTEIGVFPEAGTSKPSASWRNHWAGGGQEIQSGEQPVHLVNYVDVYNRRPITSNLLSHWVTAPATKANRCSVRRGDVFFTPTSEVREDIAVSSMALEDIPDAMYGYHLVRLRCNDEVQVTYRAHAFTAKYFLDQASVLADGSGLATW